LRLSVSATPGDRVVHQSRMYHYYLPGKSQLIYASFNLKGHSENCEKLLGYYDDRNGIFLRLDGNGNLSFVKRSHVSGTPQDTVYPQNEWNKNKCDGSGPDNFTLDDTKTQLVAFDFQWLGVGRIRCGFVHNGEYVVAHEIYNSNNLDTVYWSNPALPIRFEIGNTGTGSGTASMDQICSTVIIEGLDGVSGYDNAFSTGADIPTPNPTLIAAIRLSNNFNGLPNRTVFYPGELSILSKFSNIKYDIYRLPDSSYVNGWSWSSAGLNSTSEINLNITPFTPSNSELLRTGFVNASVSGGGKGVAPTVSGSFAMSSSINAKKSFLSQNIDATDSNVFAFVVTPLDGATASVNMAFDWREVY
jgi:hypothetical protein